MDIATELHSNLHPGTTDIDFDMEFNDDPDNDFELGDAPVEDVQNVPVESKVDQDIALDDADQYHALEDDEIMYEEYEGYEENLVAEAEMYDDEDVAEHAQNDPQTQE